MKGMIFIFNKPFKSFLIFFSCLIAGLILHRTMTANMVMFFLPSLYAKSIIHYILILIQGLFIYSCFKLIANKKMDKYTSLTIWISYFTILSFILFIRLSGNRGFNINVLSIIKEIQSDPLYVFTIILNIIIFIPLGYLFKNKQMWKSILVFCVIFLCVEIIQYIFKVGSFDI